MARKQNHPPGTAEKVATRQHDAWEMRRSGWSLRDIGAQLGVSHEQIRQDIAAVLALVQAEKAAEAGAYVDLELARYDNMLRALSTRADYGDVQAIAVALAVSKERRRLLGLDKIQAQTVVNVDVSQLTDDQLARIASGEDPLAVTSGRGAGNAPPRRTDDA